MAMAHLVRPDIAIAADEPQQHLVGLPGQVEEGRVQPGGRDLFFGCLGIEPERGLPGGSAGALLDRRGQVPMRAELIPLETARVGVGDPQDALGKRRLGWELWGVWLEEERQELLLLRQA